MMPEKRQQEDNRDWNTQQPKQNASTEAHRIPPRFDRDVNANKPKKVPKAGTHAGLVGL
jgi:hypothetical protein